MYNYFPFVYDAEVCEEEEEGEDGQAEHGTETKGFGSGSISRPELDSNFLMPYVDPSYKKHKYFLLIR